MGLTAFQYCKCELHGEKKQQSFETDTEMYSLYLFSRLFQHAFVAFALSPLETVAGNRDCVGPDTIPIKRHRHSWLLTSGKVLL